jgi:hypothetical protein
MFTRSDPMPRSTKRSREWQIAISVLLSSLTRGRLVGILRSDTMRGTCSSKVAPQTCVDDMAEERVVYGG